MNETRKPRLLLALLLSAGLAAVPACSAGDDEPPLKGATIGGPFTLTDQDGRQVSDRSFAGRYRIVYFGFTHCPDVCPADLATIGQGLAQFEKQDASRAARVQPIFITVDPERDSPAALKDYVSAFHPRLIGLTGTPEQIAHVAKGYGIYFAKENVQPGGAYSMNHGRVATLFGPDGAPIVLLPYEKGPQAIAAELDRWVK
jgi:protein SCO1/2